MDQEFIKNIYPSELLKKAKKIELLAFDVDGVLTDGGLYFDHKGNELKKFYAQDGHGIKIIQSIGVKTMIISGRQSDCVDHRARELGIDYVIQGSRNKLKSFRDHEISTLIKHVCFVGDDTVDVELLKNVEVSIVVPNTNPLIEKESFDWVTKRCGGNGAIRDVCDLIYFSKTLDDKA
tara:strand:- start:160 stop:693 length:534 start_codon:yes stop_codon:yes gene_type:complete